MSNQRKYQLGDDAMNYFTFLCCWLQITPASHCGIDTWTGDIQFHSCAHAAIFEEEDTMMYLEQGSAAFNALPEVIHHCTTLSGSHSPDH